MTVDAADVVRTARQWIDTPWMHQGRQPMVALDCVGLPICDARELGLVAPDFDVGGYGRTPDGSMMALCARFMIRIPRIELGCIVVVTSAKTAHHMGIIGDYRHGGWSLIHACNGRPAKVIETRLLFTRSMQFCGAFRLPGVVQ